jgi:hypothetical protein
LTWLNACPWAWVVFSLASNACIIVTEYINRSAKGGWGEVILQTAPLIIVAQYCLFRAFNGSSHWFTAWVVFTLGNAVLRTGGVALLSPEEVTSWTRVSLGIVGMFAYSYLVKTGLR